MAEIIRFHNNPHKQTQTLLAWYANGSLEPQERAEVEAHLAECAECFADLKLEHALSAGIANLPLDMEHGWSMLRDRVQSQAGRTPPLALRRRSILHRRLPAAWVLAAQAASVAIIAGLTFMVLAPPKRVYRALGSAPVAALGNVVAVFAPTTSESDLRRILLADEARIVDGPTAGDAYVLHVAPAERGAALARLRADSHVVLAEPIDAGAPP